MLPSDLNNSLQNPSWRNGMRQLWADKNSRRSHCCGASSRSQAWASAELFPGGQSRHFAQKILHWENVCLVKLDILRLS